MGQVRTCVLFMSHRIDAGILKEFYKMKESCQSAFDVKFFYDNSKGDFQPRRFKDDRDYELFTLKEVQKRYVLVPYWGKKRGLFYGNLIFPVLLFALNNSYEYVWRVEFDVRFSGNWVTFFKEFESSGADLLGTTIARFFSYSDWPWWKTMKKDGEPVSGGKLIRGFFPVIRLSRGACDVLDQAHRNGWKGHFEVSVGTILNHFNCKIEDVGGDGEFVSPGHRNKFYTNTPNGVHLSPGTFVFRLPERWMKHKLDIPDHLYHPVITTAWFDKLHWVLLLRDIISKSKSVIKALFRVKSCGQR